MLVVYVIAALAVLQLMLTDTGDEANTPPFGLKAGRATICLIVKSEAVVTSLLDQVSRYAIACTVCVWADIRLAGPNTKALLQYPAQLLYWVPVHVLKSAPQLGVPPTEYLIEAP
jgi:hypothetical protein